MLRICRYFKLEEFAKILMIVFFIVFQVWLDLKMPEYMQEITLLVQTEGSSIWEIWNAGLYMLLCALGSLAGAIVAGLLAAQVAASFSQRLRSHLYDKVSNFSMTEINRFSTSSLITRSTNDVTQIQRFVTMGMQTLIKAPILATWAVIKIANKGFEWSVVTGSAVLILSLLFSFMLFFVLPRFKKMQRLTDNLTRVGRENLTGLRVVRAYNAEPYQETRFATANKEITDTTLFTSRSMALMMPVMNSVMSGLSLAIYWIGAYMIQDALGISKKMVFANMVVFSSYAMQVIMAFMMIVMMFIFLPRASVSAKRINEVLDTKPVIIEGPAVEGNTQLAGEIEFKDVSFKYPGAAEYVLQNISLKIRRGQTVAFIGSTGSGKSTLINLVPRFFDVSDGQILIGGLDVKDYQLSALYNKIGYIPQKAVLFKGTISDNVGYGDNGSSQYSEEDIASAVRIAQGSDFVEKMDNKYQSDIAQGGTNLSGGQKQRLAIARAICRKPEIYIFDDSFSALDYRTDRLLRSVLKKETAGVTTLIVAQRIGTIIDADQIYVLDEGKIVGHGTHRELLDNCNVYKEIALSQLNEKELAQ